MAKLGEWRWYCGTSEDDDEMADCGTRADAIAFGLAEHRMGGPRLFWIVEARMTIADEKAMGDGKRDTAPFADTRNGQWVTIGEDGRIAEGDGLDPDAAVGMLL